MSLPRYYNVRNSSHGLYTCKILPHIPHPQLLYSLNSQTENICIDKFMIWWTIHNLGTTFLFIVAVTRTLVSQSQS